MADLLMRLECAKSAFYSPLASVMTYSLKIMQKTVKVIETMVVKDTRSSKYTMSVVYLLILGELTWL